MIIEWFFNLCALVFLHSVQVNQINFCHFIIASVHIHFTCHIGLLSGLYVFHALHVVCRYTVYIYRKKNVEENTQSQKEYSNVCCVVQYSCKHITFIATDLFFS